MMWGHIDAFTRERLVNFLPLVRNKRWLPKQGSNSNKRGKEKEEECSRTENRKVCFGVRIYQAARVAVRRPLWRELLWP